MKSIQDLAREVGFNPTTYSGANLELFTRFHDAAIAQYREGLLAGVGEAVGHLDGLDDLAGFMTLGLRASHKKRGSYTPRDFNIAVYTTDQLAAAVALERERCAKVCDDLARAVYNGNTIAIEQRKLCAEAIRGQR